MGKPRFEVAQVFRDYGEDFRQRFNPSTEQRRVMRAIELCRTAALGGHVEQCDRCGHQVISYNSCRNRHCPKCQNAEKARWREARCAEILPVDYYHVVFTLPRQLGPLALQNKQELYGLLFRAVSQTLLRIGADPNHLGAQLGFTAVLHTWGQQLFHHPHLHCVVPAGGLALDGQRWVPCKKNFFLPVRVLSRLFRRLFLEELEALYRKGRLAFHGDCRRLEEASAFEKLLRRCRKESWVVYAKPPFAGPAAVLDYLSRYTHRIAIANHRIVNVAQGNVTFTYKDYKHGGTHKCMTLSAHEFIRRFLLHVLPGGFQRIRYYGFLANRYRVRNLERCRTLLAGHGEYLPKAQKPSDPLIPEVLTEAEPRCCPVCKEGRLASVGVLLPSPSFHPSSHHTPRPP